MGTKSSDIIKKLPAERQKKIQLRGDELVAEESTLRDLRKALKLTQIELSDRLHMKQESISRLENRSDILISTLTGYIQAIGGDLKLLAEFPDRPPVVIRGFENIQQAQKRK